MEKINEMIDFFQILIPLAGAARIVFCLAAIPAAEDEAESYKKRLKNTVIFIIVAEVISELIQVISNYYGGR